MHVVLVDTWGNDERVIEAARMSTGRSFRGWGQDAKLLRYLAKHGHVSPYEQCGASVEVYAPILVARQAMRHKSFSFNEYSARYSETIKECYEPIWRTQATENKQSSGKLLPVLDAGTANYWWQRATHEALTAYRELIKLGVSREQARSVMPVCTYTRFRMSGNLRSWVHYLQARCHPHAQEDHRWLAEDIRELLRPNFPRTFEVFEL